MTKKLALALGLSLSLAACVDEVDEDGRPLPEPTEEDDTSDVDGISQTPDLPDDNTCGSSKKADGACVP